MGSSEARASRAERFLSSSSVLRSEAVDLVGHLALERRAGAAKPQVSTQRTDGGKQGEQRSQQDQYDRRDEHIIAYRNTAPAAFTNLPAGVRILPTTRGGAVW